MEQVINGVVDFSDYAIVLEHWLDTGCDFPYWCEGMDLNEDGIVNNTDDALFKGNYGDEETMPPEPDPMTWSVAPVSAGTTSIKMTATTAYDNSGNTVRYYFECYSGDCNDSAWRTSPIYTDNTLSAGNEYGYRVRAIDQNYNAAYPHDPNNGGECIGCTDWSVVGYAKTGEIPPAAPSNLGATAVSSSQIDLSWTDNSSDETGFRIERKTSGGSYSLIADVAAGTTSFSNTGLAELTTYIYRVYAYNNIGNSDYSPEATATTMEYVEPPSAPSSLTATAVSSSQINLSWTDSSTNEDGFKIERKTGSGSYALIATVTAGTISYSNTGLASSTTYTYHVYAYNSGGNSGYSNEVSATTLTLDLTPPTPNPSTWATAPSKYLKNGTYWHKMVATTATDTTPPIYYYFDCLQSNGIDSGWQTSATYDYNTGFSSPVLCDYRVRTKDSLGNVGSWSEVKRTP